MRYLAEIAPVVMMMIALYGIVPKWWRKRVARKDYERLKKSEEDRDATATDRY